MPDNQQMLGELQSILDTVCVSSIDPASGGTTDRVKALADAKAAGLGDCYVVCEKHSTRAMTLSAFIFGHYLGAERENVRTRGRDACHVHAAGDARIAFDGESIPEQTAARENRRRQGMSK